ncbi:MAG TPA: hypothetical protein VJS13_11920 [Pyrinomonadaceae bacterium]|nr:hypothetical protein [Pyrinomonadaceae bacterium]
MNCGTIFRDQHFQFSDGPEGNKLAVVLCEYGTDYLVVKTTSRVHRKGSTAGCQITDTPPNFFLPQRSAWFETDTWIELDECFEYRSYIQKEKVKDGTSHQLHGAQLPLELMKQIIDCALQSEDIDEFHLEHLAMMRAKMV